MRAETISGEEKRTNGGRQAHQGDGSDHPWLRGPRLEKVETARYRLAAALSTLAYSRVCERLNSPSEARHDEREIYFCLVLPVATCKSNTTTFKRCNYFTNIREVKDNSFTTSTFVPRLIHCLEHGRGPQRQPDNQERL